MDPHIFDPAIKGRIRVELLEAVIVTVEPHILVRGQSKSYQSQVWGVRVAILAKGVICCGDRELCGRDLCKTPRLGRREQRRGERERRKIDQGSRRRQDRQRIEGGSGEEGSRKE